MTLLAYNSTPAERARYCSFAERAESSWHVAENGGVITGTPIINFGATLDGTNDYLTYTLQGQEFNSANISIMVECWPGFDYDANDNYYLIDTPDLYRYLIYKRNNTGSNVLEIYLGNTSIAQIPSATYGPYWLPSQRNVLLVSGTSGNTNAWLNGSQILTADATLWVQKLPAQLFIGARHSGIGLFDGVINQVKIFKSLLTADDALNYYNYGVA